MTQNTTAPTAAAIAALVALTAGCGTVSNLPAPGSFPGWQEKVAEPACEAAREAVVMSLERYGALDPRLIRVEKCHSVTVHISDAAVGQLQDQPAVGFSIVQYPTDQKISGIFDAMYAGAKAAWDVTVKATKNHFPEARNSLGTYMHNPFARINYGGLANGSPATSGGFVVNPSMAFLTFGPRAVDIPQAVSPPEGAAQGQAVKWGEKISGAWDDLRERIGFGDSDEPEASAPAAPAAPAASAAPAAPAAP